MPGVFSEGASPHDILNEVGHVIQHTVLKRSYFELHLHPQQYPEFQKLLPERRATFGHDRDRLKPVKERALDAFDRETNICAWY
ncbi:MAG: hypothetical protein ACE10G_12220, partial [Gemmatimonadales bacterium]